jgi:hypothetical protein
MRCVSMIGMHQKVCSKMTLMRSHLCVCNRHWPNPHQWVIPGLSGATGDKVSNAESQAEAPNPSTEELEGAWPTSKHKSHNHPYTQWWRDDCDCDAIAMTLQCGETKDRGRETKAKLTIDASSLERRHRVFCSRDVLDRAAPRYEHCEGLLMNRTITCEWGGLCDGGLRYKRHSFV